MNNSKSGTTKLKLGIDLGGTNIKFALVGEKTIIYKYQIKTASTCEQIISDIASEFDRLKRIYDIISVGICVCGCVVEDLVNTSNLPFVDYNLKAELKKHIPCITGVENDANAAAIAELGSATEKGCKNLVLITLGTGVGGGVIIDGKVYHGRNGGSGEIGHMIVQVKDGLECVCGQRGCLEKYASVSALIKNAEYAALNNPGSILHEKYISNDKKLSGEDVFKALDKGCTVAETVMDEYLTYLAAGIDSVVNAFDPDLLLLAGGITRQGERLLNPLKKKIVTKVDIRISELQADAGALGATML